MNNDNETRYELKLDAKDFIDQLNKIQDILRRIDSIITQQGGKKYAIDVQIKNADVQRVFENLAKIMERADGSADNIAASMERAFGKSKSIDRATKAIKDYEDATVKATKHIKDTANKTSEAIMDVYKKQDAGVVSFINRSEKKAKESAQSVAAAYSKAFRETRKDLESIGVDTSNLSVKDIIDFRQKIDKMYNRRKTSQELTSSFREGWEKTLNSAEKAMIKAEERLTEQRKRNIDAETEKYKSEKLKADKWVEMQVQREQEREEQRRIRMALYGQNVNEASRMLQAQIAENNSPENQKLLSQYNRAVQRVRGIYQSAVVHGRVESPETILAGLTELQQRSLALNNYRLSNQMGIDDLNEKLKTTVRRMEEMGTRWNKFSSVLQNSVQAFATIQSFATRITSTLISFSRNVLTRISSQVTSLVRESTEAFKSLEVSLIGFKNFFGEDQTEKLYQKVKTIAAQSPGLGTTDLAEYIRQIAPVSEHNAELALNASLGMLKTIQYGGASGSTEMEYVIKNIRDVISKGKATAIDVRQFNRAMPILEEVLESVGQSQLLKDGVLTIDKNNVDTILQAFAELNTSEQSAVADIFDQMNKTLSGQWEQFREQFTTNLMEMFRGSGVYGGIQNVLMQVNNGGYVEDWLKRLQNSIVEFINGINWFEVQRVATEFTNSMKIIWEGVKDAAKNITDAIGKTNSTNAIKSFSKWIADLIRGMGDGVVQVIKFVQYLERTGIMGSLSRMIGWFGSVGAMTTKLLGTMLSHLTNIAGNVMQWVSRLNKVNIQGQLATLNRQLDAMPVEARSQIASASDLLNGTGVAADETTAINNLTNIVNTHLAKIEANQTGMSSQLGKVSYARNNGKSYFWSDNYDKNGNAGIAVWDDKNGKWQQIKGYSPGQKDVGYAEYQKLTTQNRLQASDNAFLQRVGNNKVVNSTLKWMKSAGQKILAYTQNLINNMMKGGTVLMFSQMLGGAIDSMEAFGDASTYIAGIVKTAGTAMAGAMVGSTFGGVKGGVVGALVGLGVGIADLINTIKEKEKELANTKITEAMDDAEQAMYDQTVELLREYGFTVDKESVVGAGALQQLAYYIKSTPVANRSTEEAVKYYNEAYKMLSVGYGLQKYTETSEYGATGGNQIDLTKTGGELFKQLAKMVRDYGLAETNGYYYGYGINGRSYYRDEALTEEIPAEELLKNAFPNGVTDEQARKLLEKANALDEDYGKSTVDKLENLLNDNTDFKTALDRIDTNVADILRNVVDFLGKATPENLGEWYGEPAKKQAEGFESHANGWERFLALTGVNSLEYQNEGYGTERGMDKVYYPNVRNKLGLEFEAATKEGDAERAGYLGDWINQVDNYEFGGYSGWLKDWISFILEKLTDYNTTFGKNFRFARGGLVPAFSAVGVDTVPAMLSPGEFVMKPSVVKKAGLGVMHALNRGDLGAAARSLAQNVSNRTWNRSSSSVFHNKITNNNTNNFRIVNKNSSARMNSYRSLANSIHF